MPGECQDSEPLSPDLSKLTDHNEYSSTKQHLIANALDAYVPESSGLPRMAAHSAIVWPDIRGRLTHNASDI